MEHPTKEVAMKELAESFWYNDENWTNIKDFIFNSELEYIDPVGHSLYFAAIAVDKLEEYLKKYYDLAEDAEHIRIYIVCKDCYDYITNEDPGMVADIFNHHYGEEDGNILFLNIQDCVENIEDDGKFMKEIPELLDSFSRNKCECCSSKLHGERFFMVFENNKSEDGHGE